MRGSPTQLFQKRWQERRPKTWTIVEGTAGEKGIKQYILGCLVLKKGNERNKREQYCKARQISKTKFGPVVPGSTYVKWKSTWITATSTKIWRKIMIFNLVIPTFIKNNAPQKLGTCSCFWFLFINGIDSTASTAIGWAVVTNAMAQNASSLEGDVSREMQNWWRIWWWSASAESNWSRRRLISIRWERLSNDSTAPRRLFACPSCTWRLNPETACKSLLTIIWSLFSDLNPCECDVSWALHGETPLQHSKIRRETLGLQNDNWSVL